jgi:peptidoglycan-associated lipoprotein
MLMIRQPRKVAVCMAALIAASSLGGCATKKFVRTEAAAVDARLQETQGQVTQQQGTLAQHETQIASIDSMAHDALQRAEAASTLAQGKFNYSILLTDDSVKFPANGAQLTPEAQMRLTFLADKLKSENKNVYVEVQGHTDRAENARLGEARAEAVRKFLNAQGVPLNRVSTISYGATAPASQGRTRTARAENRRAVVVVLG